MSVQKATQGDDDQHPRSVPRRLAIDAQIAGGEMHVRLDGYLDLSTAPAFEREMGDLLSRDPAVVRVDLGSLEFIDSTGLRLLLDLYRRCLASRRVLWLAPAAPSVQRIFEVTLLDQSLPFAASARDPAREPQSPAD